MKMRIQLYKNDKIQKWVNDEYVDVAHNENLGEILKKMILDFSNLHGQDSLLGGDVHIQIDKAK